MVLLQIRVSPFLVDFGHWVYHDQNGLPVPSFEGLGKFSVWARASSSDPSAVRKAASRQWGRWGLAWMELAVAQADLLYHGVRVPHSADARMPLISPNVVMRELIAAAESTGGYDVSSSNCHHAVREAFRVCLQDPNQCPSMPDQVVTKIAGVMKATGHDPEDETALFAPRCGPIEAVGCRAPGLYERESNHFPIVSNCPDEKHGEALVCAELSVWMARDNPTELGDVPRGFVVHKWIKREPEPDGKKTGSEPPQWAIMTNPLDELNVYIPFRNTRDFVDILVDLAVGSRGDQEGKESVPPEHQIGVHGGMWTALHP